jgi:hypothetical protein
MPSSRVIVCVLFWQTPLACNVQILVVIGSAAFQGVDVFDNPKIGRT